MDSGGDKASTSALRKAVSATPGVRPNIQFWMDEYNSMPSLSPEMNEAIQAKYVPRTLVYNWAQGVPTFIWELINDTSTSEGDNFGIIHGMMFNDSDFRPRPVFYTVARVNALFGNTRRDPNIAIKVIDNEALASRGAAPFYAYGFRASNGKSLVAYWLGEKVHPKHPMTPRYVDLELANAAVEHPVLIDVTADKIMPLKWDSSGPGTLRHIPLRDSVLAIADRSYFDWQTLPEVPSRLTATAHLHSVSLRWTGGDDDPEAVLIERRTSISGNWKVIVKLPGGIASYEDMRPSRAGNVAYRVRAVNSSGKSGYSNIATVRLLPEGAANVQAH